MPHLQGFHVNLFDVDNTIKLSNANDSVAFQYFTIWWNLNRGYKTKVITLPLKINTIISNEEKKMICQWNFVILSIHVLLV